MRDSIRCGNENIPKKKKQPWMTKEVLDLMSERKANKNLIIYKELNKLMQQKCREAKKEWEIQGNCIRPKQMHNDVKSGKRNVNNINGCIQI